MLQVKYANNTDGAPIEGFWMPADSSSTTIDCFGKNKVCLLILFIHNQVVFIKKLNYFKNTLVQAKGGDLFTMTAFFIPTQYVNKQLVVVGTVVHNYKNYYPGLVSNVFNNSAFSRIKSCDVLLFLLTLSFFISYLQVSIYI
jgi:hypothetical protein